MILILRTGCVHFLMQMDFNRKIVRSDVWQRKHTQRKWIWVYRCASEASRASKNQSWILCQSTLQLNPSYSWVLLYRIQFIIYLVQLKYLKLVEMSCDVQLRGQDLYVFWRNPESLQRTLKVRQEIDNEIKKTQTCWRYWLQTGHWSSCAQLWCQLFDFSFWR